MLYQPLLLSFLLAAGLQASPLGDPLDDFNVVWDSPSANHHGSMPLGNGDIALNAWVTGNGELQFYISKTDAWDDNARLLKVGKVRVRLEPNPWPQGTSFRQTLNLRDATLKVEAGEGARKATVSLWVDAHRPVIHVTAESPTPVQAIATIDLWRTNQQELAELQISDVMMNPKRADKKEGPTILEPDTLLPRQANRIGWFHENRKSVGPRLLAEVQGLTGFPQADPLLHRIFGAVVTAPRGESVDDQHLRSPQGTAHRFDVYVLTRQPATPESWLSDLDATVKAVEAKSFASRRAAHVKWWSEFWDRSWIRASATSAARSTTASIVPANNHPVRLGMDQGGGNRYSGELGRVSVLNRALSEAEITALASGDRSQGLPHQGVALFSGANLAPQALPGSTNWDFSGGFTLEAWVKPGELAATGARLVDKITPGGSDGFLFDTFPGHSLRLICGDRQLEVKDALTAGQWTHVAAVADSASGTCRLYVGGRRVAGETGVVVRDEAAYVSQMYHLQRFITACAGRGAFPIKFNGTLFTVPPGETERDPDYRRWGPGYWWQNTRLPYISLCTSGDFDLQQPLFRMYADQLLPLCKYRTKLYLGHEGAYYPECIMFWGAVFSETYGWTPFAERQDKLQESGWHKWEWVGGLELCWMMLDYYEHTQDAKFLRQTTLPFTHEILTFFDQHYPTNAQGQLVMHPSQALETWWRCTNAMPELAGCIAVTERLLTLPGSPGSAAERSFWQRLRAKLPPIPLREVNGRKALAPAALFAEKPNIENPELYPVFPFRLFAFNRPNAGWAITALENRWDRGNSGWRQDDIFMAYLGLTEQARQSIVGRARSHDPGERFPAFWGPNYDWTPDQDHGGVLMKAVQSMLLQSDGEKVFLLPAWPKEWNVEFKLHAPRRTVIEGTYSNGRMESLRVTPRSRKRDVIVIGP